ncbi:14958_t:CDS:1, partial [Gigaspora rosea]
ETLYFEDIEAVSYITSLCLKFLHIEVATSVVLKEAEIRYLKLQL